MLELPQVPTLEVVIALALVSLRTWEEGYALWDWLLYWLLPRATVGLVLGGLMEGLVVSYSTAILESVGT